MTSVRQRALDAVKVGDVIYGVSGQGNEKLLLVYKTSVASFFARHITTNTSAEFSSNGEARQVAGGGTCTIVSTAALPTAQYQVAVGLDHKVRTKAKDAAYNLSPDEIQLILTYGDFFKAHPLPIE